MDRGRRHDDNRLGDLSHSGGAWVAHASGSDSRDWPDRIAHLLVAVGSSMIRMGEAEFAAHQKRVRGEIQGVVDMLKEPVEKVSKMLNRKTVIDGIAFDSKKEAQRYCELQFLEKTKRISELQCQVKFVIEVAGQVVCSYHADFVYLDAEGKKVVEDVKPTFANGKAAMAYRKTHPYRMFALKKKLMAAVHGIAVVEV